MSEKPESEEFDEEEDEEVVDGPEDLDIDYLIRDLEKRKRSGAKPGEPAWRRLERYREERYTAELLSDFDDYEIDDSGEPSRKRKRAS